MVGLERIPSSSDTVNAGVRSTSKSFVESLDGGSNLRPLLILEPFVDDAKITSPYTIFDVV